MLCSRYATLTISFRWNNMIETIECLHTVSAKGWDDPNYELEVELEYYGPPPARFKDRKGNTNFYSSKNKDHKVENCVRQRMEMYQGSFALG
ncbi:MAG: hypothetical protein EOP45_17265 [Sphingobacteriaceae bacterium]|nr:MAG: hypothetical protein EOP45_17265 [Sphingobacteriaceae bacterium]